MDNKREYLKNTYLKVPGIEDLDMLDEYVLEYKKRFPDYHGISRENYPERLKTWDEHRKGIGTNGVNNCFYWIINDDKIIGLCTFNKNPELDDYFRIYAGHISYCVHPKYRNQGYGSMACHLLLKKCLEHNVEEAMITCLSWNSASRKVIENNFGVFKDEIDDNGETLYRFLINTKESVEKIEEKLQEHSSKKI